MPSLGIRQREELALPGSQHAEGDTHRGTVMLGDAGGARLILVPCGYFGIPVAF